MKNSIVNKWGVLPLYLFLIFISYANCLAQAPDFAWVKKFGGPENDAASALVIDNFGNSFITGGFKNTASFGSVSLTSAGEDDIFLAKYDVSGNVVWAKRAGSSGSEWGHKLAMDNSGNIYLTGVFTSTTTIGSTTFTCSGYSDIFIAKYDGLGNLLWVIKAGGPGEDYGRGIITDNSGNLYLAGYFAGTAGSTISLGNTTLNSAGASDIFIVKYNTSGVLQWAVKGGGAGVEDVNGLALDVQSNLVLTGSFEGSATFENILLVSAGQKDMFLAKYTTNGNPVWVNRYGSTDSEVGQALAIDSSSDIYVTGNFFGTTGFGSFPLASAGWDDIFIAKFNQSGGVIWATSAGGNGLEISREVEVDAQGNCYITGSFTGTVSFGNNTLIGTSLGSIFVAKYGTSGAAVWAIKAGGNFFNNSNGLGIDNFGNVIFTGTFSGTASFGNSTLTTGSGNNRDGFLAKLSSITGIPENSSSTIPASPNPFTSSFHISLQNAQPATAILTDLLGREVHRQNLTSKMDNAEFTITPSQNLPIGLYILQIQQGKEIRQVRVLKE